MASGDSTRLEKISTREILEQLKLANGDSTNFFYLYVSTGGMEQKDKKRRQLPPGQQTIDRFLPTHSHNDDTESEEDDDNQMEADNHMDSTETTSQSVMSPPQNDPSLSGSKTDREVAMEKVHKSILPKVLKSLHGWKKVYDKDLKITYRALYFNIIEKQPDEDDITHIQRVGRIRERIREEADKLKTQYGVNFKINSLLSKPILYDEEALKDMSMSKGSTQRQPQIDDYFQTKT